MSYYRSGEYYRPSFFGGFNFFPPVIKWLMISNVAIWVLVDFLLYPFGVSGPITRFLALYPYGDDFRVWQLVTYMFMHGGFFHIFFNMIMLWMFGMELENIWGSRKFLVYYLVCGVGGGIVNMMVAPLLGQVLPTVGASGAIFGVMIAFGMMFPDRYVYLYFLLPIKAKWLVVGLIFINLFAGVSGGGGNVAYFAHLGGAACGFLYLVVDMNMLPVRSWWTTLRSELQHTFGARNRVYRRREDVRDARFYDIKSGREIDEADEDEVNQEVIDAILDKISSGGYQSLTDNEKRILNDASRKIH